MALFKGDKKKAHKSMYDDGTTEGVTWPTANGTEGIYWPKTTTGPGLFQICGDISLPLGPWEPPVEKIDPFNGRLMTCEVCGATKKSGGSGWWAVHGTDGNIYYFCPQHTNMEKMEQLRNTGRVYRDD